MVNGVIYQCRHKVGVDYSKRPSGRWSYILDGSRELLSCVMLLSWNVYCTYKTASIATSNTVSLRFYLPIVSVFRSEYIAVRARAGDGLPKAVCCGEHVITRFAVTSPGTYQENLISSHSLDRSFFDSFAPFLPF